ncbi:hypothetical protein BKA56DRAFT_60714 [Ilyonectria sp. MPI-CAGE-AT-0026]|nr:hypothetical protein BKA56DRAFT_60714 [Ilyonectria sp. MPI-CAGE-AT-0026]
MRRWKFGQSAHSAVKVDIPSLPYCLIRLYRRININSIITIRDAELTIAFVPKSAANFLPVMKFIIVALAGLAAATPFRSATRTLGYQNARRSRFLLSRGTQRRRADTPSTTTCGARPTPTWATTARPTAAWPMMILLRGLLTGPGAAAMATESRTPTQLSRFRLSGCRPSAASRRSGPGHKSLALEQKGRGCHCNPNHACSDPSDDIFSNVADDLFTSSTDGGDYETDSLSGSTRLTAQAPSLRPAAPSPPSRWPTTRGMSTGTQTLR